MNIKKKDIKEEYFKVAEIAYLKRAARLLEIILEEYAYKHKNKDTTRFDIPRGRFESEGIFDDDIDYCLEHFINNKESKETPILKLDNNTVLRSNIKFKKLWVQSHGVDPELTEIFDYNLWKYGRIFEFTLYPTNTFATLVKKYNELLRHLERKKILVSKDISNFLYFEDRTLNVKTLELPAPIQIDFSKSKRRSPDMMYYFVSSFINVAKQQGKIDGKKYFAIVQQDKLLKQIKKDHGTSFSQSELSNARSNFLRSKLPQRLEEIFIIGNYQKTLAGYEFKLTLE